MAVWSAHKTARTAREGRVEQRRADAYVQVLAIAEREGRWIESWIAKFEELKVDERLRPPGPEVTDRATMSALLAACGSSEVPDHYGAWRRKADELAQAVRLTLDALSEDPDDEIVGEYLLPMATGMSRVSRLCAGSSPR